MKNLITDSRHEKESYIVTLRNLHKRPILRETRQTTNKRNKTSLLQAKGKKKEIIYI